VTRAEWRFFAVGLPLACVVAFVAEKIATGQWL
jgi:hypothetical protein